MTFSLPGKNATRWSAFRLALRPSNPRHEIWWPNLTNHNPNRGQSGNLTVIGTRAGPPLALDYIGGCSVAEGLACCSYQYKAQGWAPKQAVATVAPLAMAPASFKLLFLVDSYYPGQVRGRGGLLWISFTSTLPTPPNKTFSWRDCPPAILRGLLRRFRSLEPLGLSFTTQTLHLRVLLGLRSENGQCRRGRKLLGRAPWPHRFHVEVRGDGPRPCTFLSAHCARACCCHLPFAAACPRPSQSTSMDQAGKFCAITCTWRCASI